MEIKKILIRGPNWVGDSVLSIPAMKAIREHFSGARITLLVRPWVAGLFTTVPFVDEVWTEARPSRVSEWSRITGEIRDRHFDMAVLFPNSFESALMMFLGRVPVRLGYATDGRSLLLTNAIVPAAGLRHQTQYYLDLVSNFSENHTGAASHPSVKRMGDSSSASVEIVATADEKADARRLLASEGIATGERFLILNPGAAYGSAKRWNEERFAQSADRLGRQWSLKVAIIGSASEVGTAEKISSYMKTRPAVLTGKTTLETLIGVLSEASLMVTNDSGPMHIAAALNVPTIAVFGSTDDRITGPTGSASRIVKHSVDCSPCLLRQCPIDHRCMTGITVDEICHAAQQLINHG